MLPPEHNFFTLDQFIGANFHQDVDLLADTIPEVIAQYATAADDSLKRKLLDEIAAFEAQYHSDLKQSFVRVFNLEYEINPAGDDVTGFFAMVRAILADPTVYPRYEQGKDFG